MKLLGHFSNSIFRVVEYSRRKRKGKPNRKPPYRKQGENAAVVQLTAQTNIENIQVLKVFFHC